MPIREYLCARCRTEFEELVFGEAVVSCPACGCHEVRTLMSCCRVIGGGDDFSLPSGPAASSGGCSGCAGGNCGSCN